MSRRVNFCSRWILAHFRRRLTRLKANWPRRKLNWASTKRKLATAQANELKSQLDVEKYGQLAEADAVSKQDFDNAVQTNLANKAQVQAADAAIGAAKALIQANEAAVETATINLNFTRIGSPIDGVVGIAQAQVGDLVGPGSGTLTTISTLDPIRDYFSVSEQEYLALRKAVPGFQGGAPAHLPKTQDVGIRLHPATFRIKLVPNQFQLFIPERLGISRSDREAAAYPTDLSWR
jgi:hypothetical protein